MPVCKLMTEERGKSDKFENTLSVVAVALKNKWLWG